MEKQAWSAMDFKRVEKLLIALIILIILVHLFFVMALDYNDMIAKTYLLPLVAVMIAIVWMRKGLPRDLETILLIAFALWYFLTRMLNSDKVLQVSVTYVVMIFLGCLVLFPLPSILDTNERKYVMKSVAMAYTAIMGVLAYLGVIAMLTNHPIHTPFGSQVLGIVGVDDMRLYLFSNHPNTFACLLYIAMSLLFYLAADTKRALPRVWYGILGVGLCAAIYFTGSTTGILITGILWLMMGFLLLTNRKNATLKHTLIVLAIVLLVILLIVAGLLILENVSETQAEQSGKTVSYGSRFDDAASTFNIRVYVWGTGLQILRDRPLGLLIGELHENAMQRMTTIAGEYRPHLHNSFMETLVIGGIPAALLMVVCSALFLLHAIRLAFNKRAPLTSKILVLPLVGLFIHAIVENYIFTFDELPNLFFFLLAGMVVYESKTWRVKKA